MPSFDVVIRGGTVASAAKVFSADVGISGGLIAEIGQNLAPAALEIDAREKLVLPGGVDTHAHIQQLSPSGLMTADDFRSATTAAAFGGTTTVLSFAAQHAGMDLAKVVSDYHAIAEQGAIIDYGFHMIIVDPTEITLKQIPALVRTGHASIKVYMTYDRLRVNDEKLLDVLLVARESGALVCVHAENHGLISWLSRRLLDRGYTSPKFHTVAHARAAEAEAIYRLITFSEFLDQPVMIFHVSTAEGAALIRDARRRGVKVFAETCPQYLFLTAADVDQTGIEGVKRIFSPPPRTASDQEALWNALALGDLQVVSSDHAPYSLDEAGKLKHGLNADFKQIASGMPGIETRMCLMFDAMVSKGKLGLSAFVNLMSTQPAKIYGLYPRKGAIEVGADGDIAVWNPQHETTLSVSLTHDRTGYSPYEGRMVRGWPEVVMRRGQLLVSNGKLAAEPGKGVFLARQAGEAAKPSGHSSPEFDPSLNFGAVLY
jgi:dihydropyrimidinase